MFVADANLPAYLAVHPERLTPRLLAPVVGTVGEINGIDQERYIEGNLDLSAFEYVVVLADRSRYWRKEGLHLILLLVVILHVE